VILLAELAGWPNRPKDKTLIGALACHFLWGCVWRTCDDVLDETALDRQGFGRALSALVDATAATCEFSGTHADYRSLGDELSPHISSMVIASMREFGKGLPLNRLPDRAAPFFIVPELLLNLPEAEIDLYCHAIRLDGIAHDSHDLLDDVEKGVASLPWRWMKRVDAGASFRPSVIAALFGKIDQMLGREFLVVRNLSNGRPRPVLEVLLQEIDDVRREFASAATVAQVGQGRSGRRRRAIQCKRP
jgi:hypothetical protein